MCKSIEVLKSLVYEGVKNKQIAVTDVVLDRISYELSVIESNNSVEYFLLYSKIIEVCNELNLIRTYGRGSAAGSLVNYCLDITKINPIAEKLLFERFILPEQNRLPDIDIDIPNGSKQKVIENLKEKHPEYFVYYIALTGNYYENCELVFHENICYKKQPNGLIITREKIEEDVFIYENEEYHFTNDTKNNPIFDSKFDLIELEYLNKLQSIVNEIGEEFHPYKLPLNDEKVFEFFVNGNLEKVFQFNTLGVKKYIEMFEPNSIHDLSIINAMYRPGLIEHIPQIVENKFDIDKLFQFSNSRLNNILGETYGVLIYQETFFIICNELAGMSFSEAENWKRRIFRDKTKNEILAFKNYFIEACEKNSTLKQIEISRLINIISDILYMTFLKAHSLSYSIVGYWGAYYKTYFKKEFDNAFNSDSTFKKFEFLEL